MVNDYCFMSIPLDRVLFMLVSVCAVTLCVAFVALWLLCVCFVSQHLVTCSRFRRLLAMVPTQHRDKAIPKAKRSCTGDTRRLRDCDANASPEEIESACMIICSQLGFDTLGVPASAEDSVKFEAYRYSGELGSVIVAYVHRVPMLCFLTFR
jgi:hypothetical protein